MSKPTFETVWERRQKWADKEFGPQTPDRAIGCLEHLREEVEEALAAPGDLEEIADLLLLTCGAAAAYGATPQDLLDKADWKVGVCEGRSWARVPGTSYRKHVKELPSPNLTPDEDGLICCPSCGRMVADGDFGRSDVCKACERGLT